MQESRYVWAREGYEFVLVPREACGSRDFVEGERARTPRGLSLNPHMVSSMPRGSVWSPVGRVRGGRR